MTFSKIKTFFTFIYKKISLKSVKLFNDKYLQ